MSLLRELVDLNLTETTEKIIAEYIWIGGSGMDVRSKARVMCDAYTPAGDPIPTNKRFNAQKIFSHPDVIAEEPWYGIEQEYTLFQRDVPWPLGWPVGGFPGPQGPYYCGTGADKAFGRDIVNSHYKACLYAGINISGINGEVMPGQVILSTVLLTGYFEDRRPASNMDPYVVTSMIAETTILWKP
ncbi:hypothetical protein BHM03_00024721 [Ensete ventricosum]|uniref:glutamine synthetase n=1 Tax=Ensete ventricosum TaxID=4639 RepID=A0A445MGU8_ENSVE|nr:hypothetical protein BHM03_00024721 [Ensete ventricosum]